MPKPSALVRLNPRPLKPKKVRLVFKTPRNVPPPRDGTKLAKILTLLRRPTGASLGELVHITGWLEHSVRAALTGIAKERPGLRLTSVKSHDRLRRYYVTEAGVPCRSALPKGAAR